MSVIDAVTLCETIGGVACNKQDTGYDATLSNEGASSCSATIRYLCNFSDHITLANYLLEQYVGPTYVVGAQHPYYLNYFATSMKVGTLSAPDQSWKYATLDVTYKPLQFDPAQPSVIYEDSIAVSGEVLPLLKQSVTFVNPPFNQIDRDANYLMEYLTYKRTLKNVTTVPLPAVLNCLNKVNATAMTLHVGSTNSYPVPTEQVLYNGIDEVKISYTPSGSQRFDVTHSFLVSPVNLNFEYNANNNAANVMDRFERVTPNKYELADMSSLGV